MIATSSCCDAGTYSSRTTSEAPDGHAALLTTQGHLKMVKDHVSRANRHAGNGML